MPRPLIPSSLSFLAACGVVSASGPLGLVDALDPVQVVAVQRITAEVERHGTALLYPEATAAAAAGGAWSTRGTTGGWTQGFWTGQLWHLAEVTGDGVWADRARIYSDAIAGRANEVNNHDVGFLLLNSHGEGLRVTGDSRWRSALQVAAGSLDTHWLPLAGGYWSFDFNNRGIRAFQNIIIDTTMNLELMFVAAREFGNPTWESRALSHARIVVRDFTRADGSTRQVINYTASTGAPELPGIRWQGFGVDSTWSRGLGWGLRGLAAAARESGDLTLLEGAARMADYHRAAAPDDGVPYWDYVAPTLTDTDLVNRYGASWTGQDRFARDTSAAALIASGLLEMATLDPLPGRRDRHLAEASRILRALASTYLSTDGRVASILSDGSTTFPSIERGTAYGDHYLLEATRRARALLRPDPTFAPGDAGSRSAWQLDEPWRWSVERLDGDPRLRLQRGFGEQARGVAVSRARLGGATGSVELDLMVESDPTEAGSGAAIEIAAGSGASGVLVRLSGDGSRRGLWTTSATGPTRLGDADGLGIPTRWTRLRLAWGAAGWIVERDGVVVLGPVAGLPPSGPVKLSAEVPMRIDNPVFVGVEAVVPPPARTAWREDRFADDAGGVLAQDLADPDGDGGPNLLEYVLGTSPTDTDPMAPRVVVEEGIARLDLPNGAGSRPDVGLWIETSRDLREWTPSRVEPGTTSIPLGDGEGMVVRLRAEVVDN